MTRQIVLDTETTGLEVARGHRITEIGCVELWHRQLTGRTYQTYLDPEREIDPGASEISGLTREFLKDKPKFVEQVEEFLAFIQDADELIIHNAPFDINFLNHELKLLQHPIGDLATRLRIFDTLVLARQLHPGQKNNLDALCRRYGIDNTHRTYHGALLDAEILAKVYLKMTAGQTQLPLGEESTQQIGRLHPHHAQIKRVPHLKLTVLRASEAECQLHEARMAELNKGHKAG